MRSVLVERPAEISERRFRRGNNASPFYETAVRRLSGPGGGCGLVQLRGALSEFRASHQRQTTRPTRVSVTRIARVRN